MWDDFEELALGLLRLNRVEFLDMHMIDVYYRLKGVKDENLKDEVRLRKQCFYMVAPYWSGKMPLQYMWQIWHIPEIDGELKDAIKFSKVRLQTEEEKQKPNESTNEWVKRLLKMKSK